jgi:hypothetical protein
MRLSKSRYDSVKKVYESTISEGLRFTSEVESGRVLEETLQILPTLSEFILKGTVGWFTKPITEAWLAGKVQITLEATPADFEGKVTWAAQRLVISKDVFMVEFGIVESIAAPPITIDFGEEPAPAAAPVPTAEVAVVPAPAEAAAPEPSPRELQKAKVMKARLRAARALFIAERMTQDYVQEFCLDEDTDWEESDDDDDQ